MRSIKLETNFNNKVSSNCFVHISIAPKIEVGESKLTEPIMISFVDNPDLKIEARLIDICRLTLSQLLSIHTIPSHGLLCPDFVEWWCLKYPDYSSPSTPLAVYYYKTINSSFA